MPEIAGSQHLVPYTAHPRERWGACFWLRGLVKTSLIEYHLTGGTEVHCMKFDENGKPAGKYSYATWAEAIDGNLDLGFPVQHMHAFTDGSGGKGSSDRRLRACGWSAVVMRAPFVPGIAFFGELPGAAQTVPRAEIAGAHFATTLAAKLGQHVSRLTIYTDCSE